MDICYYSGIFSYKSMLNCMLIHNIRSKKESKYQTGDSAWWVV